MGRWYTKYLQVYERPFAEAPQSVIDEVRTKLQALQSDEPLVTIMLRGYNEERRLLAALWSLSDMRCKYPVEIIGVDNDSTDRTADVFRASGIPYYTESRRGCGFALLCGVNNARGKYYVNIDSDTMYPPCYVETMIDVLERPRVVAVGSLWSYIPDKDHSWLGLKLYEFARDSHLLVQSFKRPELCVRGMVLAYRTEYAKEVGIRTDIKRGEDGSLALGLKKYGKIAFVRCRRARAVTGYGTLGADGTIFNSMKIRAVKALKGVCGLFSKKTEYKDDESNLIK